MPRREGTQSATTYTFQGGSGMDETRLILEALNSTVMSAPKKLRKKKQMFEPPAPLFDMKDDAIVKMAKDRKKREERKKRPINKWNNSDFCYYLKTLLKLHSMEYEQTNHMKDSNDMGRAYDKLVSHFLAKMDNYKLKEYIEWWVATHAENFRRNERAIRIITLSDAVFIDKFVSRFDSAAPTSKPIAVVENNLSEQELFEIGGVPMVLMHKGIVVTHRLLCQQEGKNAISQIQKALRSFSRDVLLVTMHKTLESSPYNRNDTVDFLTLARMALQYHDIKEFNHLSYRAYFEE